MELEWLVLSFVCFVGVLPNLYYFQPVHTKVPQKTTTFERWAKRALKSDSLSLERSERSIPHYWRTQKCHRKPPLLRGKQSEPWKVTPSFSSKVRKVSLSTYPLLVHTKVPQKTNTFERRAKQALKSDSFLLERSERSFPLYIPLTGADKSATENHHFW